MTTAHVCRAPTALLACLIAVAVPTAAQQPQVGVLYSCGEGNHVRITRCENARCDVELGPPGKLTPYMTLSVAGTNSLLRSQSCVDPGGKPAAPPAAPARSSPPNTTPVNPTSVKNAAPAPAPVKAVCKVDPPSPARPTGPANAVLSIAGTPFTYTFGEKNSKTQEVKSSYSKSVNFADTRLYLLDEDADQILKRVGVETGPIIGSRFAMLTFMEGFAEKSNSSAVDAFIGLFGADQQRIMNGMVKDPGAEAKEEFDCVMRSIRSHAVAETTTDSSARGTFAAVPAGVYYVFGRFYLQQANGTGGNIWNLKSQLRAGRNQATLSIDNAVWSGAKREP